MTKQKQMTDKELDQVAGGTITVNAGHLRRFVTYTEVEIHKPSVAGSESHFNKRPIPSANQNKRPIWKRER